MRVMSSATNRDARTEDCDRDGAVRTKDCGGYNRDFEGWLDDFIRYYDRRALDRRSKRRDVNHSLNFEFGDIDHRRELNRRHNDGSHNYDQPTRHRQKCPSR